ncbi:MAG TPA: hypothetical protein PJ994_00175 [Tepidiformaceae bacterium]|nr:hypothetical protein [Tepidiformaceae bacterium]HMO97044.1 hypothetical protein [Tepidiformaceae bacterium]
MQIDYALLAEHAEVTGNKLYLMGGGWDTMFAPDVPAPVRVVCATGIRVDWDETNITLPITLTIEDDDAQEVFRIQGQMNVGRPPNLAIGSSQLYQMAATMQVTLPRFDGYRVVVAVGEGDAALRKAIPFRLARR